jgi:hypothetical protein
MICKAITNSTARAHLIDLTTFSNKMLRFVLLVILFPVVAVTGQTPIFNPVRINCGGPQHIDTATNITWLADSTVYRGNKGRNVQRCNETSLVIKNTTSTLRGIYCTNRYFRAVGTTTDAQPYEYNIPVLSTVNSYTVRLHFAEIVRAYFACSLRTVQSVAHCQNLSFS